MLGRGKGVPWDQVVGRETEILRREKVGDGIRIEWEVRRDILEEGGGERC